jgi:hypothetical protein
MFHVHLPREKNGIQEEECNWYHSYLPQENSGVQGEQVEGKEVKLSLFLKSTTP